MRLTRHKLSLYHIRRLLFVCAAAVWFVAGCQGTGNMAPAETATVASASGTTAPSPAPLERATTEDEQSVKPDSPARLGYVIVDRFPHDPAAFTQGLVYVDGIFYEGTGLYGRSTLRTVDPETGAVLRGASLPEQYFGEGITLFDGKLYQLTWKSQTGFILDPDTFELLDTFTYPSEGWGLTHDGTSLIMSDGTNQLTFLDPETLTQTGRIEVFDGETPIVALNELEYINGQVYANIWQTDDIAVIDPETGLVLAWIDLSGLLSPEEKTQSVDVLNGIAYDAEADRLFVTGKLWPALFEIDLVANQD